ncbi:hypothetical protein ACFYNZ_16290 [Streptomyces kebangsaanensis]|uniref:VCBS repeat-containing protein n=1 Tax=Streptomyces kebangsaanensis TaxID=864058 RepID=A0ABW6KV00_9ACTN
MRDVLRRPRGRPERRRHGRPRLSPSLAGADLVITFGAEDGRDAKAGPRDLVGDRGEGAEDVPAAVADYDHDRYPDLVSYGHEGDGAYSTTARLGSEEGFDREPDGMNRRYTKEADQTDQETPGSMPETEWRLGRSWHAVRRP